MTVCTRAVIPCVRTNGCRGRGERPQEAKPSIAELVAHGANEAAAAPEPTAPRPQLSRDFTEPAVRRRTSASPHTPIVPQRADHGAATVEEDAAQPIKQETRDALQTLLDRGARVAGKDNTAKASGSGESGVLQPALTLNAAGVEPRLAGDELAPSGAADSTQAMADPKLDQMFREIFESRPLPQANTAPAAPAAAPPVPTEAAAGDERVAAQLDASANGEDKKRTLLDRLRVMHERQTG